MYKFFVYLIISEKRLVILGNDIVNEDYHGLFNNSGNNREIQYEFCKTFCVAYLRGSREINIDTVLINDINEFI